MGNLFTQTCFCHHDKIPEQANEETDTWASILHNQHKNQQAWQHYQNVKQNATDSTDDQLSPLKPPTHRKPPSPYVVSTPIKPLCFPRAEPKCNGINKTSLRNRRLNKASLRNELNRTNGAQHPDEESTTTQQQHPPQLPPTNGAHVRVVNQLQLERGTKRYHLQQTIRATLGSGAYDAKQVVKLPKGENLNEWVAVHLVDFYNELWQLYLVIQHVTCTNTSCPAMSAGPNVTYLWADGVHVHKPVQIPAPIYVEKLMEWVDAQITDENIIPNSCHSLVDPVFPDNFLRFAGLIFKRLFRVYAHIYHEHFADYQTFRCEVFLNACFKRFIFFILEFRLVPSRDLEPLHDLIAHIVSRHAQKQTVMAA